MTYFVPLLILALLVVPTEAAMAPEPEPPAETEMQYIEPEPVQEIKKPIPEPEVTHAEEACNCYNLLHHRFTELIPMDAIINSATSTIGNVAVFRYPPTNEWPTGIPHVAVVTGTTTEGIAIEEYNYHECTYSTRVISLDDPRLIGFVDLE